jgi:hypothetical protein
MMKGTPEDYLINAEPYGFNNLKNIENNKFYFGLCIGNTK